MNIIALDDEQLALEALQQALQEATVGQEAEIHAFRKPREALSFIQEHGCDVAFLDIEMRGITGMEVAEQLKAINRNVNIVFVTGFTEYAPAAMELHASGYLTKPVTTAKVAAELADLRYRLPAEETGSAPLTVRCFGNFTVLHNGAPLHFSRSRAKEAFAYLVHLHGSPCTTRELAAVLFEDEPYDKTRQSYIQSILAALMKGLAEAGAADCVKKNFNSIAVDPSQIDCDYFRYLEGRPSDTDHFTGQYMSQYSWAEQTAGYLAQRL